MLLEVKYNMIQILTYTGKETEFQGKDVVLSSIHGAKSLDTFDINVIILEDDGLWHYKGSDIYSIDDIYDLNSLSIMIARSKKAKNIILLPQNKYCYYSYYSFDQEYTEREELKNMIPHICRIISELYVNVAGIDIVYENNNTTINGNEIKSSFYFETTDNVLLESDKSKKPTTIDLEGLVLSTLYLKNYDQILNFLREINLIHDKQDVPAWMEGVKMFDDNMQLKIIDENNQAIKTANDNISRAMSRINKNNEYKSILYTSGDELVNVVFEILEDMLGCDLSQFEDRKKEDFLFEKDGCVFIGEIKGVNHNVKNENVTQLDVHYQGYLDEHDDCQEDNIKAILIMNHQKNKPIDTREPVHERQINLAKRNGSLIIETITLLRLFEKYMAGSITRENCLELFKMEEGLLQI